jgi:hypothetical protein
MQSTFHFFFLFVFQVSSFLLLSPLLSPKVGSFFATQHLVCMSFVLFRCRVSLSVLPFHHFHYNFFIHCCNLFQLNSYDLQIKKNFLSIQKEN